MGAPPTALVIAPLLGVAALPGDTFRLVFDSDDPDSVAAITLVADADQNPNTTGDQTVLYAGVDGNSARQSVPATIPPGLPLGAYALVLKLDDSDNLPVSIVLPRPLFVYPGVAGVSPPRSNRVGVVGSLVVFSRGEAEDGAGALNGDGFADDGVMIALDAQSGMVFQPSPSPSMDVTAVGGGRVVPLTLGGNTLAWLTREADENRSLNTANAQSPNAPVGGADFDQVDAMISYLVGSPAPAPKTNTYGGATTLLDIVGGKIVAHMTEAGEGNPGGGTDRNLDGDVFDAFIAYVDTTLPFGPFEYNQLVFYSLPQLPTPLASLRQKGPADGAILAAEAGGPGIGGTDTNGDGDGADTYVCMIDFSQAGGGGLPGVVRAIAGTQPMGVAPATPVDPAGGYDVSNDGRVGYYIAEANINFPPGGLAGNDVNADGLVGFVPAFYDINAPAQVIPAGVAGPLNAPPGSATMIYDGTRLFFVASEGARVDPAPGTNGDGDGGGDLQILYWTDHALGPVPPARPLAVAFAGLPLQALSLDGGGTVTRLAAGWLAVVVNEAANGNQDINGSGAIDLAYLLVDTTTPLAPTVHNPGLVPSAAGTIPITGVWGQSPIGPTQGVVVRLTEAQNGDLDGDMNGTETFLGLLRFTNPTNLILLDAGGDRDAIAEGRIAITAQEAMTGRDYDGNLSITDTVFRVLDFSGNVLEPGRLCSPRSVPVADLGDLWAYLRDEALEGRNLNGDGDQTDLVLGLWIP